MDILILSLKHGSRSCMQSMIKPKYNHSLLAIKNDLFVNRTTTCNLLDKTTCMFDLLLNLNRISNFKFLMTNFLSKTNNSCLRNNRLIHTFKK